MTKEQVFRDDIKRNLILWQLMKCSLQDIQRSETAKGYADTAKKNGNKAFKDLRVMAVALIHAMDGYMMKVKSTMTPITWNAVYGHLDGECVKEISLLLDEITILDAKTIEAITEQIKTQKVNAGILLNKDTPTL